MTDTLLSKSSRFYRRGQAYPCDMCTCNSKQQANCIFSKDNVLGITAGFSPKRQYREQHRNDISASPLMQNFKKPVPIDWGVPLDSMVLPKVKFPHFPVKSWNSMMETLNRMKVIRREVG